MRHFGENECAKVAYVNYQQQPNEKAAFDHSIARSLGRTAVVRITLTEPPTGKRKQYDAEGKEMKYGRMETVAECRVHHP